MIIFNQNGLKPGNSMTRLDKLKSGFQSQTKKKSSTPQAGQEDSQ